MDGNRRWATQKGWASREGYRPGLDAAKRVVAFCLEKKIPHLSLYLYSIDNLKRSPQEQSYLFDTLAGSIAQEFCQECIDYNIRVKFVGDRTLFPHGMRSLCEKLERDTQDNDALHLDLLFCYGSQQEIVSATKKIIKKVERNELQEDEITPELFAKFLWSAATPSPDLVIRTGGAKRLSNFLLFQAAYSELYFLDCLWPDISHNDLENAVSYYNQCQRNFGI